MWPEIMEPLDKHGEHWDVRYVSDIDDRLRGDLGGHWLGFEAPVFLFALLLHMPMHMVMPSYKASTVINQHHRHVMESFSASGRL